MATKVQVVFDCEDPDRLARFWAVALGYKVQDPPAGFATWEDFLRKAGVPEPDWNAASAIVDPDGAGPRLYFQRMPGRKAAKNRVHLDLNVGGPRGTTLEERKARIAAEIDRLTKEGATVQRPWDEDGEYWVVMQDPEGNEFCLQ